MRGGELTVATKLAKNLSRIENFSSRHKLTRDSHVLTFQRERIEGKIVGENRMYPMLSERVCLRQKLSSHLSVRSLIANF
jgi:hypothetical protein